MHLINQTYTSPASFPLPLGDPFSYVSCLPPGNYWSFGDSTLASKTTSVHSFLWLLPSLQFSKMSSLPSRVKLCGSPFFHMECALGSCSFCLLQRKPHLCMVQALDSIRYICKSVVAESFESLKTLSDVFWRSCMFSIPTSCVWELQFLIHTLSTVKDFSFSCFSDCIWFVFPGEAERRFSVPQALGCSLEKHLFKLLSQVLTELFVFLSPESFAHTLNISLYQIPHLLQLCDFFGGSCGAGLASA